MICDCIAANGNVVVTVCCNLPAHSDGVSTDGSGIFAYGDCIGSICGVGIGAKGSSANTIGNSIEPVTGGVSAVGGAIQRCERGAADGGTGEGAVGIGDDKPSAGTREIGNGGLGC